MKVPIESIRELLDLRKETMLKHLTGSDMNPNGLVYQSALATINRFHNGMHESIDKLLESLNKE